MLIQHRNVWIYHFPTPRQLTLRSPENEASPPRTQVLVNAWLLYNASVCHESTEDLHIYPKRWGCIQTELNTPHNFLPAKVPIISQHEPHQLHDLTPPKLHALDSIQSHLVTPLHSMDVDSLLQMHHISRKSQTEICWHTIVIILVTMILLLWLLYFLLWAHFDKLRCAAAKTQDTACATSLRSQLQLNAYLSVPHYFEVLNPNTDAIRLSQL